MESILIFIKHNFAILWKIIDSINGYLFRLFYESKLKIIIKDVMDESTSNSFLFRELISSDIQSLFNLINSQNPDDLKYLSPHGFDLISLRKQFSNHAFLMMGSFDGEKLIGYFFLRFFSNKKCFVGRLIDIDYRGKGVGKVMNNIMYETAWRMDFRCLSTISQSNKAVMRAHAKNPTMVVLKELQNDYLLVEFVR